MSGNSKDIAISVHNVSKTFKLPHEKQKSLKGLFLNSFRKKSYELQEALKDINFDIKKGDFFGIVGRNGSGKSTLLKCMAGVYTPNTGGIKIRGSLVPFIELGVGFNPELSGRDNVFLNGALLGFSRKQMEALYDDIVEFAELEKFMDQKLDNYSSGMQVRLAFSIAIRARGDILLLDEVLAVGDTIFQQKCFNYFHQLKKDKKTVVLVSHDTNALRQFCSKGILIENGRIVADGEIDKVLEKYIDLVSDREQYAKNSSSGESAKRRHGTGRIIVENIITKDSQDNEKKLFGDQDKEIRLEGRFLANKETETPTYGIIVKDVSGNSIFSSNNLRLSEKSFSLHKGMHQKVIWQIPNIFNTGEYFISPAVADLNGKETYDWVNDMTSFKIRKKISSTSLTNPNHSIHIVEPEK